MSRLVYCVCGHPRKEHTALGSCDWSKDPEPRRCCCTKYERADDDEYLPDNQNLIDRGIWSLRRPQWFPPKP